MKMLMLVMIMIEGLLMVHVNDAAEVMRMITT